MKRKFKLEIELENAAFDEDPHRELANILGRLTQSIGCDGIEGAGVETDYGVASGLWDVNGNWTGHWHCILAEMDYEPLRWQMLSPDELEALRTAIHCRIYDMSKGAKKLDKTQQRERRQLCHLSRELNLEVARREGE